MNTDFVYWTAENLVQKAGRRTGKWGEDTLAKLLPKGESRPAASRGCW